MPDGGQRRRASVLAAIPLALGLAAVGVERVGEDAPDDGPAAVEVVFFDVGQGDCAVLTTVERDPRVIVIDGGFKTSARESVIPYLRARGILEIDLMILTHPDQDHVSGLRSLLEEFEVREIWDPGFDHDTRAYQEFVSLAQVEAGDRYYRPFDEQIVELLAMDRDDEEERLVVLGEPESFGRLQIVPLHSNRFLDGPTEAYRINNSSIVVKVVVGGNSILFTGDANGRPPDAPEELPEGEREEALFTEAALLALEAQEPGLLRSTVLKVPHHGSLTSSSGPFVDAVRPQWALVSSGTTDHRLPRAATLALYGESRANILRTDALDTAFTRGDDHLVLLMGEAPGHLVWRQAGTRSLLESLGG